MMRTWRRGFALADFLAGSIIFSGTLSLFVALTHSKFRVLEAADLRSRAEAALEVELDRVRLEGPGGVPGAAAKVDADGFRLVREFSPTLPGLGRPQLPAGRGEVAVRALRTDGAPSHQLFEARVLVTWEERPGDPTSASRLAASTVVLREEAR